MKRNAREQAREMRCNGKTVQEIAQLLSVSKSTVSLWVRDIQLSAAQIDAIRTRHYRYGGQNKGSQANRTKYLAVRSQYQEAGRAAARERRPLHMAGCMLYWAEGAKSRNMLYFVNSDPNMMRFFTVFLREELAVSSDEMTITIHCHYPDRDSQRNVERYWLDLLGLSETALRKTQYKKGSEFRKNTLVNGVCGLRVTSSRIIQHIYGAIQEYAGFDNPAWLF